MRRHFSLFRGFPRPRLGVLGLPRRARRVFALLPGGFPRPRFWAFVVSHAGRAGFCSVVGRLPAPPLGRFSPAPSVPFFLHASSLFAFSRVSSSPLGRSLPSAPGVPVFCSIVGRVPAPPLLGVRCLPRRACRFVAPLPGGFPRRGRIPIGKQALPRSAGKGKAYRKRRKLTNELPPLLNGIIGHALRFAPAALLPRNIRYGKTACRPTLPVSRG